eukprot:271487-Pyramimonas_sp.AAC.1
MAHSPREGAGGRGRSPCGYPPPPCSCELHPPSSRRASKRLTCPASGESQTEIPAFFASAHHPRVSGAASRPML